MYNIFCLLDSQVFYYHYRCHFPSFIFLLITPIISKINLEFEYWDLKLVQDNPIEILDQFICQAIVINENFLKYIFRLPYLNYKFSSNKLIIVDALGIYFLTLYYLIIEISSGAP
jgi:hypothetical protein